MVTRSLKALLQCITPLKTRNLGPASLERPVASVVLDSRQVVTGSLFVAVPGAKIDGRSYIPEALRRGCLAVVVEDLSGLEALEVPLVLVADCLAAVGELAAAWQGYPAKQVKMIGITGTNGKTTCTWLIEALLLEAGQRPGVIGTVNYRCHGRSGLRILQDAPLTTPDAVTLQQTLHDMVAEGTTHVIMEVSSHALDQHRLGSTLFDVALFTNLSRDHLDYHASMEAYFSAKQQLFTRHLHRDGMAVVVTGPQAEGRDWGEALCQYLQPRPMLRCGLSPQCDISAQGCDQRIDGFTCQLYLKDDAASFHSSLTGSFNILNILAAAGVGVALGLPATVIREGLANVTSVPGRLERVQLPGAEASLLPSVFVDYAHTPDALENVLTTLKALASGRVICLFGCGGDRDRGKRPLMGEMAGRYADVIIVSSDNPRSEDPQAIIEDILPGVRRGGKQQAEAGQLLPNPHGQGFAVVSNRQQAIALACGLAGAGDSILIAGKGHENYQIIGSTRYPFDDSREAVDGLLQWRDRHLLAATGGRLLSGALVGLLGRVCTDSRSVQPGDIFVALKGEQFDGHAYINQAVTAGAGAVIAERFAKSLPANVLAIEVADTLRALGDLAGYRRRLLAPELKVAAITGSSGKTSVKEMVAAIFTEAVQASGLDGEAVLKTQGNFNNLVGLPLSLLPIKASHRLAIVEMGMNVPGEIARLAEIADPDIGCINNVHPAHLQGLGSVRGVAAAKGELFATMRPEAVRVVNMDDAHVRAAAKKFAGNQIGFAVSPSGRKFQPLIRATRPQNLAEQGMRFTLHIGDWQQRLTVPVLGAHNVSNCVAAAAIAHAAGIAPEIIVRALRSYVPSVDKRLAITALPGGLKVVNDAYNANPASMAAGLRTVAGLGEDNCRHAAALGDMLELGTASERLHADIGRLAATLGYQYLALTGPHAPIVAQAAMAAGMEEKRVCCFADPQTMAPWFSQLMRQGQLADGDWLLIKGSRGMRMERLLTALDQEWTPDEND